MRQHVALTQALVGLRRGATRGILGFQVGFDHLVGPMDLGLDTIRTSGRAASQVTAEIVRELSPIDLALLETERGVKPPAIKTLRDSHHAIARCIAKGMSGTETQLITGYSASRISILKSDPAFQELVAFYKGKIEEIRDAADYDLQSKLSALHSDTLDIISERLNENPAGPTIGELVDIAKFSADRSGHGPQSKSTSVNVNVDLAARVSAGRQRAARVVNPHPAPIEGEVVSRTPLPPPLAEDK